MMGTGYSLPLARDILVLLKERGEVEHRHKPRSGGAYRLRGGKC